MKEGDSTRWMIKKSFRKVSQIQKSAVDVVDYSVTLSCDTQRYHSEKWVKYKRVLWMFWIIVWLWSCDTQRNHSEKWVKHKRIWSKNHHRSESNTKQDGVALAFQLYHPDVWQEERLLETQIFCMKLTFFDTLASALAILLRTGLILCNLIHSNS